MNKILPQKCFAIGTILTCLFFNSVLADKNQSQLSQWRYGKEISCKSLPSTVKLNKMASAGDIDAQVYLSWANHNGNECGIKRDELTARDWAQKAADAGDSEAQLAVAYYYYRGVVNWTTLKLLGKIMPGTYDYRDKDEEKVWPWVKKSAEQGYPPAYVHAGRMFDKGYAQISIDPAYGFELYGRAARRGYAEGYWLMAEQFYNRVVSASIMNNEEVVKQGTVLAMLYYKLAERTKATPGKIPNRLPKKVFYEQYMTYSQINFLKEQMTPEIEKELKEKLAKYK